jgi:hypothetical protein
MLTTIIFISPAATVVLLTGWAVLTILLLVAGLRRLLHRRARRRRSGPVVDDDAIARIIAHGTLVTADDEPLDEDEIARAEAEFWEESWEDPDEYAR